MVIVYSGAQEAAGPLRSLSLQHTGFAAFVLYVYHFHTVIHEREKMKEALILTGRVYTVVLIIFHVFFWRIFRWPETLMSLNSVNRATMQVLNISITFIFFIFAYISFTHTDELLNTALGRTMLVLISMLWLFRAVLQIIFYKWKHKASVALALYFLLGAFLYGLPVVT